MHIKKGILIASAIAIFSLPMTASAEFETNNYTDEDSSVQVTSGTKHPCSSSAGVTTPKRNPDGSPGYSSVKDGSIALLCLTSKGGICTADIFNTANCSPDNIGSAELDLRTKRVKSVSTTDRRYNIEVAGGGTIINLRYR